jgi:hypothetical protein
MGLSSGVDLRARIRRAAAVFTPSAMMKAGTDLMMNLSPEAGDGPFSPFTKL